MSKTLKNYRLNDEIIKKLEALQNESGKTATDIVEAALNYVHEEYSRAIQGKNNDGSMLAQVLGKRIDKAS